VLQSIRPRGTRQRLESHDAFVIVTRGSGKNANVDFQQLRGARQELWMLGETTWPLDQGNTFNKNKDEQYKRQRYGLYVPVKGTSRLEWFLDSRERTRPTLKNKSYSQFSKT
jgi:hypothetical protein